MLDTLEKASLEVYMVEKYVDDFNLALSTIEEGYEWKIEGKEETLVWGQDRQEADQRENNKTPCVLNKLS